MSAIGVWSECVIQMMAAATAVNGGSEYVDDKALLARSSAEEPAYHR